jgi:hypothetical protein
LDKNVRAPPNIASAARASLLIPYSPWRKEKDQGMGPWDAAWPHSTLYPGIDAWPGNERWFSNRCSPMASEFTIHQNIGPAAAIFGFLCQDEPR